MRRTANPSTNQRLEYMVLSSQPSTSTPTAPHRRRDASIKAVVLVLRWLPSTRYYKSSVRSAVESAAPTSRPFVSPYQGLCGKDIPRHGHVARMTAPPMREIVIVIRHPDHAPEHRRECHQRTKSHHQSPATKVRATNGTSVLRRLLVLRKIPIQAHMLSPRMISTAARKNAATAAST